MVGSGAQLAEAHATRAGELAQRFVDAVESIKMPPPDDIEELASGLARIHAMDDLEREAGAALRNRRWLRITRALVGVAIAASLVMPVFGLVVWIDSLLA
jgi:hypothetical protein